MRKRNVAAECNVNEIEEMGMGEIQPSQDHEIKFIRCLTETSISVHSGCYNKVLHME